MPKQATVKADIERIWGTFWRQYIPEVKTASWRKKNMILSELYRTIFGQMIQANWDSITRLFNKSDREKDIEFNEEWVKIERKAQLHSRAVQKWWNKNRQKYIAAWQKQIAVKKRELYIRRDDDDDDDDEPAPPAPPPPAPAPRVVRHRVLRDDNDDDKPAPPVDVEIQAEAPQAAVAVQKKKNHKAKRHQ